MFTMIVQKITLWMPVRDRSAIKRGREELRFIESLRLSTMTKAKTKLKAVKAIEKSVKKAVHKGVSEEAVDEAVEHSIDKVAKHSNQTRKKDRSGLSRKQGKRL